MSGLASILHFNIPKKRPSTGSPSGQSADAAAVQDGRSKSNASDDNDRRQSPTFNEIIEDKIYTFRTITTMLGRMQYRDQVHVNDTKSEKAAGFERKQLQIYNALAAVAVMDTDVIAVATDVSAQGLPINDNPESVNQMVIRVVVSSTSDELEYQVEVEESDDTPVADVMQNSGLHTPHVSDPEAPSLLKKLRRMPWQGITFAKNFYTSNQPESGSESTSNAAAAPTAQPAKEFIMPTIQDAKRPDKLHSDTDEALSAYLGEYLGPGSLELGEHLKLEEHLWMLSWLLCYRGKKLRRDWELMRYVIATCYPKIRRRLSIAASKPYLKSLRYVDSENIPFTYNATGTRPPSNDKATQQDQAFLMYYILLDWKGIATNLKYRDIGVNIPNIRRKAQSLLSGDNKVELYDAETCSEFGHLLNQMLFNFEDALKAAADFRSPHSNSSTDTQAAVDTGSAQDTGAVETGSAQETGAASGPKKRKAKTYNSFREAVEDAVIVGHGLSRLTEGVALTAYLQDIEDLLEKHNPHFANLPTSASNKGPDSEQQKCNQTDEARKCEQGGCFNEQEGDLEGSRPDEDSAERERDQDLEAAGEPTKRVWLRYLDWLKVIVSHFEAIRTLLLYVDGKLFRPYHGISMRILHYPVRDTQLLSWKALLNLDSKHGFPKKSLAYGNADLSNMIISDRLDQACKVFSADFLAQLNRKSVRSINMPELYDSLTELLKCNISSLSTPASLALEQFKYYNKDDATKCAIKDEIVFFENLRLIGDWKAFFKTLREQRGEDKVQSGFKGAIHCEVCLTSLLHYEVLEGDQLKSIGEQIKRMGRVIGVSKRCCPVCEYLLSRFLIGPEGSRKEFIVKGSHTNVTGCDLPPWLPMDIVDDIIQVFGEKLRDALMKLITEPKIIRRSKSIDSDRLSTFSNDEAPTSVMKF